MLRFFYSVFTAPLQLPFTVPLYSAPLYSAFDLCYSVLQRLYTASLQHVYSVLQRLSTEASSAAPRGLDARRRLVGPRPHGVDCL